LLLRMLYLPGIEVSDGSLFCVDAPRCARFWRPLADAAGGFFLFPTRSNECRLDGCVAKRQGGRLQISDRGFDSRRSLHSVAIE
jgi:hypothetical protein